LAFLLHKGDPADLRLLSKVVEVPRDKRKAPPAGATEKERLEYVVRVKVCEIPDGLYTALEAALTFARMTFFRLAKELSEEVDLSTNLAKIKKEYLFATEALFAARREIVKWGVCDHVASDFADESGVVFPFLAEQEEYDLVKYRVCAESLVAAYQLAAPDGEFLSMLCDVVCEWQYQRVLTPDDIWEKSGAKEPSPLVVAERLRSSLRQLSQEALLQIHAEITALLAPGTTMPESQEVPTS
jgi:hypothetical protein